MSAQARIRRSLAHLSLIPQYHVDLSSLFHWNTKQVFVYLAAEYFSGQGVSVILFGPGAALAVPLINMPCPLTGQK